MGNFVRSYRYDRMSGIDTLCSQCVCGRGKNITVKGENIALYLINYGDVGNCDTIMIGKEEKSRVPG